MFFMLMFSPVCNSITWSVIQLCYVTLHTDNLQLKIPWKNLYGAPVVAVLDGVYVVVGPASGRGWTFVVHYHCSCCCL